MAKNKIPDVIFAGTQPDLDNRSFPSYLLSEENKYANDKLSLKKMFIYHENLAMPAIKAKRKKIEKNYKLAYGQIDYSDYGIETSEYADELKLIGGNIVSDKPIEDEIKLDFFPILPAIKNSVVQELERKYQNFFPRLVDSESINEILNLKNSEIISSLIDIKKQQFEAKLSPEVLNNEEQYNQAMSEFQKLPEIEQYYKTSYKHDIVKWVEHLLQRNEMKFNLGITHG